MTREESIKVLKNPHDASDERIAKAIDMAIEALELVTSYEDTINKLTEAIANTQELKTGHWISSPNDCFAHCSECGLHGDKGIYKHYKYCPNCGRKMESEE